MSNMDSLFGGLHMLSKDFGNVEGLDMVTGFMRKRPDIPLVTGAAYLVMVFLTRNMISPHKYERLVNGCFAVWNLGLSLFSFWGLWNISAGLMYPAWKAQGMFFTVCGDTKTIMQYAMERPGAYALALFCLSKIPELGDTVFLILKRKPVRLLQWYHHVSVMLFCWLALATEYTPGLWFATTNYFVHSIMYLYFFLMTFKSTAWIIKPIGPLVTIIQISQMVWGLLVNGIAIYNFFATGNCQIRAFTVYCALAMYLSYFVLFTQFWIQSRSTKKKAKELAGKQR